MAPQRKRMVTSKRSISEQVRRAIVQRAEKKVGVTGNTTVGITTAGTVINLSNNIVQGDDFFQRTGDKIFIQKVLLKMRGVALVGSQTIRFIFLSDRFNQGTTPAVGDILQAANFIATYNQLTVVQQKRFVIHGDWSLDCNFAGEAIKSITKTYGEMGSIFYNGSTAVAASNGKGSQFLLVIGSAATGTYDFNWEGTFTDT